MRHKLLLISAMSCLSGFSMGLTVVAPNGFTSTEANSNNTIPFFWFAHMSYQQVYRADQFAAMAGGGIINGMSFRLDGGLVQPFSQAISMVVSLSTTAMAPDGLSTTFANNVGSDVVTVFSGTHTFSSAGSGGTPGAFDITLPFTSPFTYNPGNGNLLMEVRMSTISPTHQMDAENTAGDSISRLIFSGSASAQTGSVDSLGLITQFSYSPVPEPASMIALGAGIAGLLARRRRR